jgi:hypothetical protein
MYTTSMQYSTVKKPIFRNLQMYPFSFYIRKALKAILMHSGNTNATRSIVPQKENDNTIFLPLARHKCYTNRKILICVDGRQSTQKNRASTHENRLFCPISRVEVQSRVSASRHKHISLTNRSPGIFQRCLVLQFQ